mmetsp:Transcript_52154/g.169399  ORF Transcript_52154/g.169399 Transcript_52154/m.169399 type:complete len:223 (+) Transcript_52154:57-725(+)
MVGLPWDAIAVLELASCCEDLVALRAAGDWVRQPREGGVLLGERPHSEAVADGLALVAVHVFGEGGHLDQCGGRLVDLIAHVTALGGVLEGLEAVAQRLHAEHVASFLALVVGHLLLGCFAHLHLHERSCRLRVCLVAFEAACRGVGPEVLAQSLHAEALAQHLALVVVHVLGEPQPCAGDTLKQACQQRQCHEEAPRLRHCVRKEPGVQSQEASPLSETAT